MDKPIKVKRGGKKEVWKPRIYRFERGDFQNTAPSTPSYSIDIGTSKDIVEAENIFSGKFFSTDEDLRVEYLTNLL